MFSSLTRTFCLVSAVILGWTNPTFVDASLRGNDGIYQQEELASRVLEANVIGTFLIKDEGRAERDLQAQQSDRQTFSIGLADGRAYEVENAPPGWARALVSGHDKVLIPSGSVISSDGTIDVKGKNLSKMNDMNNGPPGDVVVRTPEQERNLAALRSSRMLRTGTKTVLAVRIIVNDGAYSWTDQTGLSNDVFGNGVDTVNLKSQYAACSYNQLIFEKAPDRNMLTTVTPNPGDTNIVNGVVDIKVNNNITAGDATIVNAVTAELNRVFGVTSPTALANYVMYCLPSGAMSGIAYAYINSWNSVYSNQWCNYVSAQMHEIGHNLNFAHSNEAGTTYADQTGMMGYSYSQDDGPVMCFNGAKSWQTGWYTSKSKVIIPDEFFESNLHGISDYNNAVSTYVLFKINDSTATDIYVAYNRKTGINSGTVEAGNQVTITRAAGEGTAYAESELLAKLSAGANWTGTVSGRSVTVHVKSMLVESSLTSAQVSISWPTSQPTSKPTTSQPTSKPTSQPSSKPSSQPTVEPTTSQPTSQPTAESLPPTMEPTTASPTMSTSPTFSPTTSTPTESPTSSPTQAPVPPTVPPSAAPTQSPTMPPSGSPTVPPTAAPTQSPTNTPTRSPTNTPTNTPSKTPTSIPTSRAPSSKPTTRQPTTKKPTPPPTRKPTKRA